ncbi:hypothetical protein [Sorangium sp. So ce887]
MAPEPPVPVPASPPALPLPGGASVVTSPWLEQASAASAATPGAVV